MRLAFVALYGIFDQSRTALTGSALVLKVAKSRRKRGPLEFREKPVECPINIDQKSTGSLWWRSGTEALSSIRCAILGGAGGGGPLGRETAGTGRPLRCPHRL